MLYPLSYGRMGCRLRDHRSSGNPVTLSHATPRRQSSARAGRVNLSPAAGLREYVPVMRLVFTSWVVGIFAGLAYMFAVVAVGR
jgi:hypothetical protein